MLPCVDSVAVKLFALLEGVALGIRCDVMKIEMDDTNSEIFISLQTITAGLCPGILTAQSHHVGSSQVQFASPMEGMTAFGRKRSSQN